MECGMHGTYIQPNDNAALALKAYTSQIWNLYEGGSLFSGKDSEFQTYRSRAHLAEMISLIGLPPPGLLARGNQSTKFFFEGKFNAT